MSRDAKCFELDLGFLKAPAQLLSSPELVGGVGSERVYTANRKNIGQGRVTSGNSAC